jgi:autotransporter-associated beta strand protein
VAGSTLTQVGTITANGAFILENAGTATVSGAIGGVGGAQVISNGTTTLAGNITTPIAVSGAGLTTVSGNLSVASVLTKTGAGTTILTGAGNAQSGITIGAGILQIGNGVAAGSTGTSAITNNATLAFNTPDTFIVTAANEIGGTGVFTKTGLGTVVLSGAVANTFGGVTTVSGGNLILSKTSGINAIGGNLVIETGGIVSYGTTAGQLADHIPDTASITINGGTFGSGAGATLAAPTAGVADTVAGITVNSGSFLSGRGPGTIPAPFVVTGDFKLLGGTGLVQRGGGLSAGAVQIASPAVLDLDGGSATAGNLSRLLVGAGGLTLSGATINLNAGPSAVGATSVGSIVTLGGNVTSTGTSGIARLNPTLSVAIVDLDFAERTFDVTGTLTIAPEIRNGSLRKTGAGTLVLTGTNTYADGTYIDAGKVNASADVALGLTVSDLTFKNGATLQADGAITSNRAVILDLGGGVIDTNGNAVTFDTGSNVSGTALTKIGAGTLTLAGAQTYATLNANGGTTAINSALGTGTSTVNANAAVQFGGSQTLAALNIGNGAVVTLGAAPAPAGAAAFGGSTEISIVPEPGALSLLALGVVGVLARRRRAT